MLEERIRQVTEEKDQVYAIIDKSLMNKDSKNSALSNLEFQHDGLVLHLKVLYENKFTINIDFSYDEKLFDLNERYRRSINGIINHRDRIAKIAKIAKENPTNFAEDFVLSSPY